MMRKVNESTLKILNRRDNGENGKTENTKVGLTVTILYNDDLSNRNFHFSQNPCSYKNNDDIKNSLSGIIANALGFL